MSDDAAVRALYQALIEGWNRRDAGAMADLFLADGHVVGFDGSQLDGADAIRSVLGGIFAQHPTPPFVSIVREVQAIQADTVLLRAAVGMPTPGQRELNPALNAIQSLVAVRRDGGWRIALFQNTPAAFHGNPAAVEALNADLRRAAMGS